MYGGDEGARTPDLDSAIVALFQLSYIPLLKGILPYSWEKVKGYLGEIFFSFPLLCLPDWYFLTKV
jgi:hypothetical protein